MVVPLTSFVSNPFLTIINIMNLKVTKSKVIVGKLKDNLQNVTIKLTLIVNNPYQTTEDLMEMLKHIVVVPEENPNMGTEATVID